MTLTPSHKYSWAFSSFQVSGVNSKKNSAGGTHIGARVFLMLGERPAAFPSIKSSQEGEGSPGSSWRLLSPFASYSGNMTNIRRVSSGKELITSGQMFCPGAYQYVDSSMPGRLQRGRGRGFTWVGWWWPGGGVLVWAHHCHFSSANQWLVTVKNFKNSVIDFP